MHFWKNNTFKTFLNVLMKYLSVTIWLFCITLGYIIISERFFDSTTGVCFLFDWTGYRDPFFLWDIKPKPKFFFLPFVPRNYHSFLLVQQILYFLKNIFPFVIRYVLDETEALNIHLYKMGVWNSHWWSDSLIF